MVVYIHETVYSGGAEPGIDDRGVMNLCISLCRVDVFKRIVMSRRFVVSSLVDEHGSYLGEGTSGSWGRALGH